jgi:hypothetical protein
LVWLGKHGVKKFTATEIGVFWQLATAVKWTSPKSLVKINCRERWGFYYGGGADVGPCRIAGLQSGIALLLLPNFKFQEYHHFGTLLIQKVRFEEMALCRLVSWWQCMWFAETSVAGSSRSVSKCSQLRAEQRCWEKIVAPKLLPPGTQIVLNRVHWIPPLVAVLSQLNLCHASLFFFFQIYFNIILLSDDVNRAYFYLPHTRDVSSPHHLP